MSLGGGRLSTGGFVPNGFGGGLIPTLVVEFEPEVDDTELRIGGCGLTGFSFGGRFPTGVLVSPIGGGLVTTKVGGVGVRGCDTGVVCCASLFGFGGVGGGGSRLIGLKGFGSAASSR